LYMFDGIFPMGLGTNRLPVNGPQDGIGIERSVKLVLAALDAGVNYIDTACGYSCGMAETVLKIALEQSKRSCHITLKSQYSMDKTSDDVFRRAESAFKNTGTDHAKFFLAWCIKNYAQFEQIMQKGSLYEGAVKLKNAGLIDHICFSSHANADDTIRIIGSGAFEALTLSFSLLNSVTMRSVLETAASKNIAVVVMNPLGGGVIPQNSDYFGFARNSENESTVQAALRYVSAHPAIKVVLTGPASEHELRENIEAWTAKNDEQNTKRITRINKSLQSLEGFCTGCRYCDGCPEGIPVYAFMQSHNSLLFASPAGYNRNDPEVLRNIQLLRKLYQDFSIIPESPKNPCTKCGQCETKCTQSLPIMEILGDIYQRIAHTGFSLASRKNQLKSLLNGKGYKKVGFYPGARYTILVLEQYEEFFGEPEFECLLFDSNPKQWNTTIKGLLVHSPDEIRKLNPDCILVSNYNYADEIYQSIAHYQQDGITIINLHKTNDVPWGF